MQKSKCIHLSEKIVRNCIGHGEYTKRKSGAPR
jgi:hypothetical protein